MFDLFERLHGRSPLVDAFPPAVPWTDAYVERHRRLVAAILDDPAAIELIRCGRRLPAGWGIGYDERVVEYPWLFAQELRGRALDAGSVLNHAHILERFLRRVQSLHIVTLAPEAAAYGEKGVSYIYEDLRDLPYGDGWFDTVLSISTLEHVGMDNSQYGGPATRASDPEAETTTAIHELRRVLAPHGSLYVTVPYGAYEDHGWFRQFDRASLERLIAAAQPHEIEVRVFGYSAKGWQVSDLDAAVGSRYRVEEYMTAPDRAAAARAVACLRMRW